MPRTPVGFVRSNDPEGPAAEGYPRDGFHRVMMPPPFSFSGPLLAGRTPRWYCDDDMWITILIVSLQAAGSSATVFKLYRNATLFQTLTLPSGLNVNYFPVTNGVSGLVLDAGDYIWFEMISPGDGAEDLDIQPLIAD